MRTQRRTAFVWLVTMAVAGLTELGIDLGAIRTRSTIQASLQEAMVRRSAT